MPQAHPADLSRLQWLRNSLAETEEEIIEMRKAGSWQALTAARRQALKYRNELDDLLSDDEDDELPSSLGELVAMVLAFPNALFRAPAIVQRVVEQAPPGMFKGSNATE